MRTLHNVFHLHCFVCAVCCRPLTRGDQYVVRAGQVVCRADYEKEYFMVQGFSPPELLQDGQQGITKIHFHTCSTIFEYAIFLILVISKIFVK